MKENEAEALEHVFKAEGGFAERPEEGGGAVNMGITMTTFTHWRMVIKKQKEKPTIPDLKAMTKEEATEIYRYRYLDKINFNELPAGVDYAVFDAAVHSGVVGSIRFLQEALGFKYEHEYPKWDGHLIDGDLDLDTMWAVHNREPRSLIYELVAVRKFRQDKILDRKDADKEKYPNFDRPKWAGIWGRRNNKVRDIAYKMLDNAKGRAKT